MVSIDPQALAASLRKLEEKRADAVVERSLQRVTEACTELFDIDGSGLLLANEHAFLHYVVASGEAGRTLEETQLEIGEGPCMDTFFTDELVETKDVQADRRWPRLRQALSHTELRAVLGVPVHLAGVPVASIDVFRFRPTAWDESERRALTRYAEVVSAILHAALQAEHAGELADQLHFALDYRVPIERGVGYLMARDGISVAAAFTKLRGASRSSRRKIGEIAEELLATGRLPAEADANSM